MNLFLYMLHRHCLTFQLRANPNYPYSSWTSMVFCALKPHLTREVYQQLHEILLDPRFDKNDLRNWACVESIILVIDYLDFFLTFFFALQRVLPQNHDPV
jgi:hypothetical protein